MFRAININQDVYVILTREGEKVLEEIIFLFSSTIAEAASSHEDSTASIFIFSTDPLMFLYSSLVAMALIRFEPFL